MHGLVSRGVRLFSQESNNSVDYEEWNSQIRSWSILCI